MYDKKAHEKAADLAIKIAESTNPLRAGQPPGVFRKPRPEGVVFGEPYYYLERRCHAITLEALQPLIELKWDRLIDVTEGLGAGYSGMGEVCGAVTGAIIAFGLDLASRYRDQVLLRLLISRATHKFMRAVKEEFGSYLCRDINRHDLSHFLEEGDKGWDSFVKDESAIMRCGAIQRFTIMYPLPHEEGDYLDVK